MKRTKTLGIAFWLFLSSTLHSQIPVFEEFVVVKNETAINSKDLEFSPSFNKDGLVFISTKVANPNFDIEDKKINQNIMSIFWARRNSEGYLEAPEVFAEELLSQFHEGPLTFDRTNQTLYFTRNNTDKDQKSIRKLKIYSAQLVGDKWQNFKELPFNLDDYETCHPSISADDDVIYFASDREGGFGGMDIWMSKREGGDNWSEPVNLGSSVNSPQNEVFPYVAADGTLYFSSNGYGGSGQLDVFYTLNDGDNWLAPVNLGKPFNSEFDDFGFIIDRDNKNGYFSSNRKGGLGADDIYNFYITGEGGVASLEKRKKGKPTKIAVNAVDPETGLQIEDVEVSYIGLDDMTLGEALRGDGTNPGVLKLVPSGDGQTYRLDIGQYGALRPDADGNITVPEGSYIMKVEKDGYQPQYITVTPDMMKNGLNLQLEKATNCVPFYARVFGKNSQLPQSGATIILTNTESGAPIKLTSDGLGEAYYCLPCNQSFNVLASKGGQLSNAASINTFNCAKSAKLNVNLFIDDVGGSPLVAGTVIQLPNIYFNFNDAALRPDARTDLDAVVAFLEVFPDLEIELASHTDSRGTARYNKSLSQNRSDNVMNYLLEKGISQSRMKSVGYGESQLRNKCFDGIKCTENEHQENRRTELVILKAGSAIVPATNQVNVEAEPESPEPVADVTDTSEAESAPIITGGEGQFFVVAGTFRNLDNANTRLGELKTLGYDNTQIIQFVAPYQAVCVAAFESEGEAKDFAKQLQDQHSIDTYVRHVASEMR